MKVITSTYKEHQELPLKLNFSFEAVFEHLEKLAEDQGHIMNDAAKKMLDRYADLDILRSGFSDTSVLNDYNEEIDELLDILFPDLLKSNEIKAASIPFEFTTFKLSQRFEDILANAGENYELHLRNYEEKNLYIMACAFILAYYYDFKIDFKRPFFYDIPDVRTGITRHYRTVYNGDFFKVKPLENAPELTQADMHYLLDNFDNIEVWKEKFPPNSYEFRGFGMVNLFDVTVDESISSLKENLLRKDDQSLNDMEGIIGNLFGSQTIKFGFSAFEITNDDILIKKHNTHESYILKDVEDATCSNFFCQGIVNKVFDKMEPIAISDMESYGKHTNYNGFYKTLSAQNINSVILVPLDLGNNKYGVMEFVSENRYELNSINANKLKDIIPIFQMASQRMMEEYQTQLESIIQEYYTSLHPTVKWRFLEEAENFLNTANSEDLKGTHLESIVFDNVMALYGQTDIKGSSIARNNAIQKDLVKQLNSAARIIRKAEDQFKLPIYSDLLFRIRECQDNIRKGLNSGDEVSLTDFLKNDIYPVFNHLKYQNTDFKEDIANYMAKLNPQLLVIYEERKKYEESVNRLNEEMADFIDKRQVDAQKMFPHYFERYKTDGIDYNIYIGQSLVRNKSYDEIHLSNLRLWQLEMMCDMEFLVHNLKDELTQSLEVASLILVHSSPLAIKFRMDEKRFDVDGAYNIRYEIIKKRIDKALIKGSNERLTQPGKIAIVYNQHKNAEEYFKFIKYLQHKKYLLPELEMIDVEDLQGIAGLKAIRVAVNYERSQQTDLSIEDIMKVIDKGNLN